MFLKFPVYVSRLIPTANFRFASMSDAGLLAMGRSESRFARRVRDVIPSLLLV